ncbi:MAG: FG-GAP-like repeat-containing protein [Candidatus Promineifilaceae bacterium]
MSRQATAGGFSIVEMQPQPRTVTAPTASSISLQFDQPVNPATVTSDTFWAFGRWSGTAAGNYTFSNNDQTVTLTPPHPFSAGEQVMVIISNQIESASGTPLRSAGYSFQFWTKAAVSNMEFEILDTLDTRTTPSEGTRAYGGTATDFNNDGWLDLTIVNEDTADLRIFLNKADGTGLFNDFLTPTTPVSFRASPNETSDFNRDGFADIAVLNIDASTVSILLGNGDGTFAPQQQVNVGSEPRGIGILDVDGDGDTDIVNTNSGGSGNLSLLVNDGNGVFAAPVYFEGGVTGEFSLIAADMNEDAILDLVIGARATATMAVSRGNGDGTFNFLASQSAGGATWMINAGDVNGDGHEDIASANSENSNGAILIGDGMGNLQSPITVPIDPFALATDLGDVDGDGDLDWITSSFSGNWILFLNNGGQQGGQQGTFTNLRNFESPQAASCSLFFDFDNDGDLDLALIDEIADKVVLIKNGTTLPPLQEFIPFVSNEE